MQQINSLVMSRLRSMLALLCILALGACTTLPAPQVNEKRLESTVAVVEPIKLTPVEAIAVVDTQSLDLVPLPTPKEPDAKAIECLSRSIYFEARGESTTGQIAVGYVILNRTRDSRFPDTACGVVQQKKKLSVAKGKPATFVCEFNWYCEGKTRAIKDKETYAKIQALSRDILLGNVANPIGGCLYFHATHVKQQLKRYALHRRLGNHIFYS